MKSRVEAASSLTVSSVYRASGMVDAIQGDDVGRRFVNELFIMRDDNDDGAGFRQCMKHGGNGLKMAPADTRGRFVEYVDLRSVRLGGGNSKTLTLTAREGLRVSLGQVLQFQRAQNHGHVDLVMLLPGEPERDLFLHGCGEELSTDVLHHHLGHLPTGCALHLQAVKPHGPSASGRAQTADDPGQGGFPNAIGPDQSGDSTSGKVDTVDVDDLVFTV